MTRGCLPSAAGTLAMFAAVYAMVYGLTARTYERIVGGIG